MRLHVVLYEPEIPANTGNIMRTCMATNANLHLIGPLGFQLSEKSIKRSGMDYLLDLDYKVYIDWDDFKSKNNGKYIFITRYGKTNPKNYNFNAFDEDIYLIFGKESTGIPYNILHNSLDDCIRLPMVANARSLNLANCVAVMVYHVLGEFNYPNLSDKEVLKGEDWIYEER